MKLMSQKSQKVSRAKEIIHMFQIFQPNLDSEAALELVRGQHGHLPSEW